MYPAYKREQKILKEINDGKNYRIHLVREKNKKTGVSRYSICYSRDFRTYCMQSNFMKRKEAFDAWNKLEENIKGFIDEVS